MELSTHRGCYTSDENPYFSKPLICGSFSIGPTRNYLPDNSRLKFLRGMPPDSKARFDLNHNADTTVARVTEDERLEFLCHYLRYNNKPINVFDTSNISLANAPFINYRGFLREISALPYQFQDPCRISVCLFRGAIYMHTLENPVKKQRRENPSDWEKKCSAWGYKFEQFLLSDESDKEPDLGASLNQSEEFSCVYETKLGHHKLIYAAEMDGLLCAKTDNISKADLTVEDLRNYKFVELKTSAQVTEKRHDITFRKYKVLAWWLQSFFAGVETILCGYRNNDGIVKELKSYNMFELPKSGKDYWHPNVCMNFCNEFLTFVKQCLAQELQLRHGNCLSNIRKLPRVDLLLEMDSRSDIQLRPVPSDENISAIPQWYTELFPEL